MQLFTRLCKIMIINTANTWAFKTFFTLQEVILFFFGEKIVKKKLKEKKKSEKALEICPCQNGGIDKVLSRCQKLFYWHQEKYSLPMSLFCRRQSIGYVWRKHFLNTKYKKLPLGEGLSQFGIALTSRKTS